jgi:hypothetical protein
MTENSCASFGDNACSIDELLNTLHIRTITAREGVGGVWVEGTIGGHTFQALIFPDHAANPAFEREALESPSSGSAVTRTRSKSSTLIAGGISSRRRPKQWTLPICLGPDWPSTF